jgi:hypothetical protein
MSRALKPAVRLAVGALFILLIAAFSQGPAFAPIQPDHGQLKLSLAHLAERREVCRQLSEAEQQALPPTRRVSEICERGRASTRIRLELDDQVLLDRQVNPAGLHGDGRAYLLKFIDLPAGRHQLTVALSDRPDEDGFDKQQVFILDLAAGDAPLLAIGDGDISLRQAPAPTKEISP